MVRIVDGKKWFRLYLESEEYPKHFFQKDLFYHYYLISFSHIQYFVVERNGEMGNYCFITFAKLNLLNVRNTNSQD